MNVSDEKFCLKVCREVDALLKLGRGTDLTKANNVQRVIADLRKAINTGNMKDKKRMDDIELKMGRMQTLLSSLQDSVPKKKPETPKKAKK